MVIPWMSTTWKKTNDHLTAETQRLKADATWKYKIAEKTVTNNIIISELAGRNEYTAGFDMSNKR
jgi:hypothetical protein